MTTVTSTLRPGWNPISIGLMVLGFVLFWPLGLAMLAYILWGDRLNGTDLAERFRGATRNFGCRQEFAGHKFGGHTGNVAFDEYRERELKRLEEERRRIETMRTEFDEFLRNLRRAKDQEEFDRFMSGRNAPSDPAI
jgi:hypothetical protein